MATIHRHGDFVTCVSFRCFVVTMAILACLSLSFGYFIYSPDISYILRYHEYLQTKRLGDSTGDGADRPLITQLRVTDHTRRGGNGNGSSHESKMHVLSQNVETIRGDGGNSEEIATHIRPSGDMEELETKTGNENQPKVDLLRLKLDRTWTREEVGKKLLMNSSEWRFHPELLQQFRNVLRESLIDDPRILAVLHHENTKIGQYRAVYTVTAGRRKSTIIDKSFWNTLPERSPFEGRMFDTCSVVGSAGLLSDRHCGDEIDKTEFVFRMNDAPVSKKYKLDVGSFTNLTTLNGPLLSTRGSQCLQHSFSLSKTSAISTYKLTNIQMVRLPSPARNRLIDNALAGCMLRRNYMLLFGNPEYLTNAKAFWTKFGDNKNISAGLYVLTLALAMCEQTHVYGFWPYDKSPENTPVKYHYYNNNGSGHSHNFSAEFSALMQLHDQGIIQLHIENCRQ